MGCVELLWLMFLCSISLFSSAYGLWLLVFICCFLNLNIFLWGLSLLEVYTVDTCQQCSSAVESAKTEEPSFGKNKHAKKRPASKNEAREQKLMASLAGNRTRASALKGPYPNR